MTQGGGAAPLTLGYDVQRRWRKTAIMARAAKDANLKKRTLTDLYNAQKKGQATFLALHNWMAVRR